MSEEGAAAGGAIGSAFIAIRPEMSEFNTGLQGGIAKALGMIPGPVAAIAGTIAVVGGGILAIGEHFQGAYNKIAVGTGAVGSTLKTLEGDFRNTLGNTSGSFDQVSAAVTTLYQRTGLTGKALDDFAAKEVMLGKITKTDVGENTQATTELFNKFGIAAGKQSGKLDELFKASQIGGKGIQALAGDMKSGGIALQSVGFDFDHSAALIANLEKAGINVAPTLAAMKKSLAEFAKEGKDPQKAFEDITTAIKNAKTPTEALGLSIKTFGTRAGPELVAAIRSGKFEVGDLVKQISNGKGGIMDTAEHVSTLGEKFELLKNKAVVALEPIASGVVGLANNAFGKLLDVLPKVFGWVEKLWGEFTMGLGGGPEEQLGGLAHIINVVGLEVGDVWQNVVRLKDAFMAAFSGYATGDSGITGFVERLGGGLRDLWNYVQRARDIIGEIFSTGSWQSDGSTFENIVTTIGMTLKGVADFVEAHLKPILIGLGFVVLDLIAPWASISIALIYAYTHFKIFRDVVNAVAKFLADDVAPIVAQFAAGIVKGVAAIVAYVQAVFPKVSEAVGHVMAVLKILIIPVLAVLYAAWYLFGQKIWDIVKTIFSYIVGTIQRAMNILGDIINVVLDLINGDWGKAWHDLLDIFKQLWDEVVAEMHVFVQILWDVLQQGLKLIWEGIVAAFDATVSFFADLPGRLVGALASLAGLLLHLWLTVNLAVLGAIEAGFLAMVGFFVALPGRLIGGLGDLAGLLGRFFVAAVQWTLQQAINAIAMLLQAFFDIPYLLIVGLAQLAGVLWDIIGGAINWAGTQLPAALGWLVGFFLGLPGRFVDIMGNVGQVLWNAIGAAITWLGGMLAGTLSWLVGFFAGLPGRFVATVGNVGQILWDAIGGGLTWIGGQLGGALTWLVGFFSGLPGRFAGAAGDVFGFLWTSFKNAINLVIRGWNSLHFHLPEIDTHIPGVGKIGGADFGVPQIPLLEKGGLFKGLALVGERGPELVNVGSTSRVFPNGELMAALEKLAGNRGPAVQVKVDNHGGPPMTSAELVQRLRGVELLYVPRR